MMIVEVVVNLPSTGNHPAVRFEHSTTSCRQPLQGLMHSANEWPAQGSDIMTARTHSLWLSLSRRVNGASRCTAAIFNSFITAWEAINLPVQRRAVHHSQHNTSEETPVDLKALQAEGRPLHLGGTCQLISFLKPRQQIGELLQVVQRGKLAQRPGIG